jgi:hypothetical protein
VTKVEILSHNSCRRCYGAWDLQHIHHPSAPKSRQHGERICDNSVRAPEEGCFNTPERLGSRTTPLSSGLQSINLRNQRHDACLHDVKQTTVNTFCSISNAIFLLSINSHSTQNLKSMNAKSLFRSNVKNAVRKVISITKLKQTA